MKRVARVIVGTLLAITLIGVSAIAVVETQWFKRRLVGIIVREAGRYLDGTLSIDGLSGNLFHGIELDGVVLAVDGRPVISIGAVKASYGLSEILSRGIVIQRIEIDRPAVAVRKDAQGWELSRLVKKQRTEAERRGPNRSININHIDIEDASATVTGATARVDIPKRFDRCQAALSFQYEPVHLSVAVAHISCAASDPDITLNEFSGGVSVRDDNLYLEKLVVRTERTMLSIDGAVQHYQSSPVMALQVEASPVSLPEIGRVVPEVRRFTLEPSVSVRLNGPSDRLGTEFRLDTTAGDVNGRGVIDLSEGRRSFSGQMTLSHLNLATVLNDPAQKSDITGDLDGQVGLASASDGSDVVASFTLRSPRIEAHGYSATAINAKFRTAGRRLSIDGRAVSYGSAVSAVGDIVLPAGGPSGVTQLNLRGHASHMDLRRLPSILHIPPAATDLSGTYHVTGSVPREGRTRVTADAHLEASTIAGTGVGAGAQFAFSLDRGDIRYQADMDIAHLDLRRLGDQFELNPLKDSRFDSDLAGHVMASVHGTELASIEVTAKGTVTQGAIAGGQWSNMSFDATIANDSAHAVINGTADDFNPAVLADRPSLAGHLKGPITADVTFDSLSAGIHLSTTSATVTGELGPSSIAGGQWSNVSFKTTIANDSAHAVVDGIVDDFNPAVLTDRPSLAGHIKGAIAADLTFDSLSDGMQLSTTSAFVTAELGPLSIGDVSLDRAAVAGDFRNMVADFQTLEAVGSDLRVTGNGTLAFNDTGKSGFWLHAEAGDLTTVGKLVGQPLSGIAVLDTVVGGNQREFTATGTLTGDGLKYKTLDALSSSAKFSATIPNLEWERTSGNATTDATFVTIAGVQVNRLTAKTEFAESRVTFDVSAEQPQRSLTAGGSLVLEPDDKELRLQQLKFVTQGVTLQTPPGQEAVVTYSEPSIGVRNFRLQDATMQRIAADGAFGRPGDVLKVTFGNIDMGLIDALLLRPPQFSGRLNGTSDITGARDALVVNTTFQVDSGKFQNFSYESLKGTVQYAPQGATVDVRLQQTVEQWLTAKGHVPLAAFRQEAPSTDRYDLHVDSSLIDLGLVEGFTTRVSGVTGTLQVRANVTGSADAPRLDGDVTVQRGGFKVEDTGVRYTGLDGKVALQGDRVHIDTLQLRDNQNKLLTVSGDLGVGAHQVETVNLAITADDFKVIDNEMGNVRVRSALRVAGAVAAPRLEGDLRITSGTINLDKILARASGSAYATSSSAGRTDAGTDAAAKDVSKAPLGWEGVESDVHLVVDDNLVVKASDISGGDRLVGLGSINLTLGGNLNFAKKAGEPLTVVGNVNTVRGFYDFQGRRFMIQRDGILQFEGDPIGSLNPRLAVTGERVISAVTARVTIGGRLRRPEVTFSSTPPLDPSDILALIVFNQPLNELGANAQQSVTKRAGDLALGVGTGQLTSSIASSLKLDQFDINLSPDTGSAADLTIGQQINGNLYVRVEQGVGQHTHTNVILEYEFSKWLRLQTNVQEGANTQQQLFQRVQSTGADLVFTFAFK